MKYFSMVLRYLFSGKGAKKCLFYFLFAVIPAAFIAYTLPLSTVFELVRTSDPISFGKLWLSTFTRPFMPFMVVASLLTETFISACICSALTYHMRVGKFGLPRFFSSVNNNFFPCFSRALILGIALILFYTVFVLFESFWRIVFSPVASIVASALTLSVLMVLFGLGASSISLWLPTMVITGRSFKTALATAFNQPRSTHRQFLSFYALMMIIAAVFSTGALFIKNMFISWALTALSYLIILVFIHVFWFIAFFEENKMTRADLTTYQRRS